MATELRWKGLNTDADPMDLPPGAAVEQVNLTCITPGKLTPRKGFRGFTFSGTEPGGCTQLPISMYRMRTVNGDSTAWQAGGSIYVAGADGQAAPIEEEVDPDQSSCFAQTRKGWLVRINGVERGSVRIDDRSYPLGLSPPSASPVVTASGGGGSYDAVYWCGYRYRDEHDCYSSLSPLVEVSAASESKFQWSSIPASDEERVTAIELYRSIADDPEVLYLVGVLENIPSQPTAFVYVEQFYYRGAETITLRAPGLPAAVPAGGKILFYGPWSQGDRVEVTLTAAAAQGATTLAILPLNGVLIGGGQASWARITPAGGSELDDVLTDDELLTRAALPILYSDGALCARRFEPPPDNMAVCVPFQDRLFYAVQAEQEGDDQQGTSSYQYINGVLTELDEDGQPMLTTVSADDRNVLYYSEPDEYESVPRTQNALTITDDADDSDRITALLVHGSNLFVGKDRHVYRINYSYDPRIDGTCRLVCKRGVLHQRAFGFIQDTCYLLDQLGAWALDGAGGGVQAISDPIQDYWRDARIDYTRADRFFVSVEPNESVVRFHVLFDDDPLDTDDRRYYPTRALCYATRTGAWWEESYPLQLGGSCRIEHGGRIRTLVGCETGAMLLVSEGIVDAKRLDESRTLIDVPIHYWLKTGFLKLPYSETDQGTGKIVDYQAVATFTPTVADEKLVLRMYWDHEERPVAWTGHSESNTLAVRDATDITISMRRQATRTATNRGWERWPFNFRSDPKVITHHSLSLELRGTVRSESHTIHDVQIEGRR